MRKRLPIIIMILVFLVGLVVILYPFLSNFYNQFHQAKVINDYKNTVAQAKDEQLEEEKSAVQLYNEGLLSNVVLTDPFEETAAIKMSEEYERLLNLNGDGNMGYIEIPDIDVQLSIFHGTSTEVLANGVGHLEGTSLPIGGLGTHAVLSTHSGYPKAKLFTDLVKLKRGDLFYITILNDTLAYQIDQINVVLPSDISDLEIDRNEDYVTLLTCTPYGVNTHRLLVRGTRIPYEQSIEEQSSSSVISINPYIIAAIILIIIIFVITLIVHFKIKRKEER